MFCFIKKYLNPIFFLTAIPVLAISQPGGCIFRDTLFSINFGAGKYIQDFNLNSLKNYQRDYSVCPDDGFYAYASKTSDCFNGDWITLTEDHTPNDNDGKMMLINASHQAGDFFIAALDGFKPSTTYEFSIWMLNVCKVNGGCPPLPPDVIITLETSSGKRLAEFKTGKLLQSYSPSWKRYAGFFSTSDDVTKLTLKMSNTTNGGCGNDFAMDDINFRECYPPPAQPDSIIAVEHSIAKPGFKEIAPVIKPVTKNISPVIKETQKDTIVLPKDIKSGVLSTPPGPLLTRENYLVKQIETGIGELQIELYDNGQVDGDTVSIYHNNELIVSRAGLSEIPITFKITVNDEHPYHELVMVAENLGSIPPNTSLMIVKSRDKRYEIFISSSEQKNAKLIIREK